MCEFKDRIQKNSTINLVITSESDEDIINEKKSLMSQNVDETEEYELEEKTSASNQAGKRGESEKARTRLSQLESPTTATVPPSPPATVCERSVLTRDRLESTDERAIAAAAAATSTNRLNSGSISSSWFNFNKLSISSHLAARKRSFNVPNESNANAFLNLEDNDLSRVSSALILNKENSGAYFKNIK